MSEQNGSEQSVPEDVTDEDLLVEDVSIDVSTHLPKRVFTFHTLSTDKRIHDRILERVTHV